MYQNIYSNKIALGQILKQTKNFNEATFNLIESIIVNKEENVDIYTFNRLLNNKNADEKTLERVAMIFYNNGIKNFEATFDAIAYNNKQTFLTWLKDNNLISKLFPVLSYAVDFDNYDMIDFLLQNGEDVNVKNGNPKAFSPLAQAFRVGNLKMAEYLIEKGADVNQVFPDKFNRNHESPVLSDIWQFVMNGYLPKDHFKNAAEILLKNNFKFWDPAYSHAVLNGKVECLQWLFDHVPLNDSIDELLMSAISSPLNSKTRINIVDLLLDKGANVNYVGALFTPLILAVKCENIYLIKHLIEKGADVNLATSYGWTPLKMSINKRHTNCLKTLIEYGVECPKKLKKMTIKGGKNSGCKIYNYCSKKIFKEDNKNGLKLYNRDDYYFESSFDDF